MFINHYKIKIISKEHHSEEHNISSTVLLLGRSHACDIRFSAPDVSGRHIELQLDEFGKPFLRNLSMRRTLINDDKVTHEAVNALHADDLVQLGDEVMLKILYSDDQGNQIPGSSSDADLTLLPQEETMNITDIKMEQREDDHSSSVTTALKQTNDKVDTISGFQTVDSNKTEDESDAQETMVMQTRIASPEEIELLRKQQNHSFRKKNLIYLIGFLISIGIIVLGWVVSTTNKETTLSWPLDSNGNFNDEVLYPNTETGRDFLIYFPRCKDMRVSKNENNFIVETRIGKLQDVSLRLEFYATKSMDILYTKRENGFKKWIDAVMRKGGKWNFDSISEVQFRGKNNGVPYQTVKYSRAVNGKSWFGIACYMKFRNWEFVLLKEIPTEERWRGERLLERETFISVSPAFVEKHWEYNGSVLSAPSNNMLEEARSMLDRTSPAMWPQISEMLISVMIRSLRDNEITNFEKAQIMIVELRQKQTKWLNAKKIEYFNALAKNKYKEAQRIRENCRGMFSDENDQRFHFIRRDQWE